MSTGSASGPRVIGGLFLCMWGHPNGLNCNHFIRGYELPTHLREAHGVRGADKLYVECKWDHCGRGMKKESLSRHIEETHMGVEHPCHCGKIFSRRDTLTKHQRSCSA
ncbi:hypothetical protein DFH29DRAFT_937589 [Suillus ampliporus]|nr:hypothetical protein DFH29DRAFT_937589 [Suillus ampliporus]